MSDQYRKDELDYQTTDDPGEPEPEPMCPNCGEVGEDNFTYEGYYGYGNTRLVQRICRSCDHTVTRESEPNP